MPRKSAHIAHYTATDLQAKAAAGEDMTDWHKAASVPVPDGSDPDDAMEPVDWATTELPMPRRKTHASLRLDADMLDWFKSQGRGYQTRINAILRSYYLRQEH